MYEQQLTTTRPMSYRIEWGPAHLRDDAQPVDVELTDRPDDN